MRFFPFLRGKNRISQGVENRGSLISVPLGLREYMGTYIGNGPNTVLGSTVSNTELSEVFGAHWVLGSELSEFLLA